LDYSAFGDHFERLITQHIMSPRYGWPSIPIERRRCTQSAALALALPAKLKNVAAVLELEQQKDESGHRVMMQMAKPRRPRQGEDPAGVYWFDDTERREQLYAYCKQDVATERALHAKIEGLTPEEQLLWGLDSTINDRGLHIDGKLLDAAINIAEAAEHAINTELQTITKGALETIHQTAKLVAWLADQDCVVTDVQKTTLKRAHGRTWRWRRGACSSSASTGRTRRPPSSRRCARGATVTAAPAARSGSTALQPDAGRVSASSCKT
jgi:DNA polymerase